MRENTSPIINTILYLATGAALWFSMLLPGWVTIAVLLAGIGLITLNFKPGLLALLLILSVPLEIKQDLAGSFTVYTTEAILFMGLAAWLLLFITRGRQVKIPGKGLSISILLFLAGIVLSFLFTKNLAASLKQFIRWVEVIGAYMLAYNFLGSRKEFTVKAIIITGALTAVTALYQFMASAFDYRAVISFFGSYNPYAGYLGLIIPLALAKYIYDKNKNNDRKQLFYTSMTIVLLLSFAAAFSRGGWVGLILSLSVMMVLCSREAKKKLLRLVLIIPVIAVATIILSPPSFNQPGLPPISKAERLTAVFSDNSVRIRLNYWKAALESVKDHVFTGVGAGNYQYVHEKYGIIVVATGFEWMGDTIATLAELEPNINYQVSFEYRVLAGDTGSDDALEMVKYDSTGEWRVFETNYPNVILIGNSREWSRVEGVLYTGTSLEALSDINLRWAHNQKATVQFRDINIVPDSGSPPVLPDYSFFHLHNLYLQILVEAGIIGLIAFLGMVFIHLFRIIKNILKEKSGDYIILGCLCGIIAFLIHSFVDILFTHSIGILFGIILGLAVSDNNDPVSYRQ